jgi:hypothetical protein
MSMDAADIDIGALITRTPGIKGGTPHIAGTGVTVICVNLTNPSAYRLSHMVFA